MSTNHTVQAGECISSIAFELGVFPDTLWNDPANGELKRLRKDPNVLLTGDTVVVMDKRLKEESGATEKKHRFRRKGVPEKLRLKIEDEQNNPITNAPYTLTIDGNARRGTTDADGMVIEPIPPNARQGKLVVGPVGEEKEYPLELGHLDPIDLIAGVQQRLTNLGFPCPANGELDPLTKEAIGKFQAHHKLPVTNALDETTRNKIKDDHGC